MVHPSSQLSFFRLPPNFGVGETNLSINPPDGRRWPRGNVTGLGVQGAVGIVHLFCRVGPDLFRPSKTQSKVAGYLDLFELGAGVLISFLPSREMILLGTLLSFGSEFARQYLVQDKSVVSSCQSALLLAIETASLGRLSHSLSAPFHRVRKKGLGTFVAMAGTPPPIPSIGPAVLRLPPGKEVNAATREFLTEEVKILRRMQAGVGEITGPMHRVDINNLDSVRGLESLVRRVDDNFTEYRHALSSNLGTLKGRIPADELARRDRHLRAFLHELDNDLTPLFSPLRSLSLLAPGRRAHYLDEAQRAVPALYNLFDFYGNKPALSRGLLLLKERGLLARGTVVIEDLQLKLGPMETTDFLFVQRELCRNGLRVAASNGNDARVVIRRVAEGIVGTADNAGGFSASSKRKRATTGAHGMGQQIIHQIVEANGWDLTAQRIPGGTEFILKVV